MAAQEQRDEARRPPLGPRHARPRPTLLHRPATTWQTRSRRVLAATLFALVSAPLVACQVLLPSGTTDCKKFCKSMTSCAGPLSFASYCEAVCPLIGDQAALDCYVKEQTACNVGDLYGACQADFCGAFGEVCSGSCQVGTTQAELNCRAVWLDVAALEHSLGTCPDKQKAACARAVAAKCSLTGLPAAACK